MALTLAYFYVLYLAQYFVVVDHSFPYQHTTTISTEFANFVVLKIRGRGSGSFSFLLCICFDDHLPLLICAHLLDSGAYV